MSSGRALVSRAISFCTAPAAAVRYTLSLHDALPISPTRGRSVQPWKPKTAWRTSSTHWCSGFATPRICAHRGSRSEEHTSELQSRRDLVCRLLLEKKKDHHRALAVALHRQHFTERIT